VFSILAAVESKNSKIFSAVLERTYRKRGVIRGISRKFLPCGQVPTFVLSKVLHKLLFFQSEEILYPRVLIEI
jgi:hypothetical protein